MRLLLVSMYPLDRGMWGPTVRISHLRDALSARVDIDVVSGYRGQRRAATARFAFSGRLRGLDGIYVESSSFLPAETDIAFLGLARALRIPVLTYIRDAYQLFDDYAPRRGLRARLGSAAFRPMLGALGTVSSRLAFPTAGLAHAVGVEDPVLLPPGSPRPVTVAALPTAHRLLFVGDARLPAHGADRLIAAVALAREQGADVELMVVCRPGQEPPGDVPGWLTIERAEGDRIHDLLPGTMATVIPRPRNAYNDIALPIKLFDYLSYGRPLLVTDCLEQAAVVRDADAGLVVGDAVEALADGIIRLAGADADERDRWSANAAAAAVRHAWGERAETILALLRAERD